MIRSQIILAAILGISGWSLPAQSVPEIPKPMAPHTRNPWKYSWVAVGVDRNFPGKIEDAIASTPFILDSDGDPVRFQRIIQNRHSMQDHCSSFKENSIAVMNPGKYIECKSTEDGAGLIPLFVVGKSQTQRAYFSASFITNSRSEPIFSKDSSFRSDANLRKYNLHLIRQSSSLSGHVAPLHFLWSIGLIERPTVDEAAKFFANVRLHDNREQVVDGVSGDSLSFGAVPGELASELTDNTRTAIKYALLPHDVIVISANLKAHRSDIETWLRQLHGFNRSDTSSAPTAWRKAVGIDALIPFDTIEHGNAFAVLHQMYTAVNESTRTHANVPWAWIGTSAIVLVVIAAALRKCWPISGPAMLIAIAAVLLVSACLFLLMNGMEPAIQEAHYKLGLLLLFASLSGSTLRHALGQARIRRRNAELQNTVETAPYEIAAGICIAFGFYILFLLTTVVLIAGPVPLSRREDFLRVGVPLAAMAMFGALGLEGAYLYLTKKIDSFRDVLFEFQQHTTNPAVAPIVAGNSTTKEEKSNHD